MDLDKMKIEDLSGVGVVLARKFKKLGIQTVSDLLYHYPRKYEDFSQSERISDLIGRVGGGLYSKRGDEKVEATIAGQIVGIANKRTRRRGFTVTEAIFADESGTIKVVWFNQPFLQKSLFPGKRLILNGKVYFDRFSKSVVMESPSRSIGAKIVPIYPETEGLSSFMIKKLVQEGLRGSRDVRDFLPGSIREKYKLFGLNEAINKIHLGTNFEEIEGARKRISFDEFFMIAMTSKLVKEELKEKIGPKIVIDIEKIKKFVASLPYELTNDQKKALWRILKDMEGSDQDKCEEGVYPMNRLLNGDVGTGKTVVAAGAIFANYLCKKKSILMAPTEILATQHFQTLTNIFGKSGLKIALVTANSEVNKLKKKNSDILNDWDVLVGTQALISGDVKIENLGLCVVDEQHRFGVAQRSRLLNILDEGGEKMRPHFLSMTATPIPRSLQLALFGDLDVSIIREKPAMRKKIITKLIAERNRGAAYDFIKKEILKGRQAFVICPLIEEKKDKESDGKSLFDDERKTVKKEFENLKKIFVDSKIAMLHGKMKGEEKDKIMSDFSKKKYDILVSTSLIEVGVDVPNATVMMIEDAERFGLSQLHQFRGRVGRGEHQSYCYLFSSSMSEKSMERVRYMENIDDGFKLSEMDLKMRGGGEMFGTAQSGLLDLKLADISNLDLISEAAEAAGELVATDPKLNNHPDLKKKMQEFILMKHME